MFDFDLVVTGGTIATASDTFQSDIGINNGRIVALAEGLSGANKTINAAGKMVLPGGVEAHCHIEQESAAGIMTADDYKSGSISAAFGGNTTIIPFAAQHRGQSLRDVVKTYRGRADPKSVIDYTFHLIVSDPTEQVLGQELPALIMDGYTSFKVYMTYELLKIDDRQMLDVLSVARKHGAMTMVHAENNEVINWLAQKLIDGGNMNGRRKTIDTGIMLGGVSMGSQALYDWTVGRQDIVYKPISYTHDSALIGRIDNFVSINSGLEIDLFGQLNAETLKGKQVSGTGGSVDFMRGAARSRGGRSIVAMTATAAGGRISRIVPAIDPGSVVTGLRTDIDHVVTEHGVANLRNLPVHHRPAALIEIAGPDFRDSLRDAWRDMARGRWPV